MFPLYHGHDFRQLFLIPPRGNLGHRRGVALTPLRPVGVIEIDGVRHDALAETGAIDERSEIEVVEVLDNQIKVRPHRDVEKSAG